MGIAVTKVPLGNPIVDDAFHFLIIDNIIVPKPGWQIQITDQVVCFQAISRTTQKRKNRKPYNCKPSPGFLSVDFIYLSFYSFYAFLHCSYIPLSQISLLNYNTFTFVVQGTLIKQSYFSLSS